MIFGRPPTLWLGAITALLNVAALVSASLGKPIEPGIIAGVNLAAGAIIALVAGQPPTLAAGDTYKIATPSGQPNYEATVAAPPAVTKPVLDPDAAK